MTEPNAMTPLPSAGRRSAGGGRPRRARVQPFHTDAGAFWWLMWDWRALAFNLTIVSTFVSPLIVLLVDDVHPSGTLYGVVTAVTGFLGWLATFLLVRRHPQAREYARSRPLQGVVLSAVVWTAESAGFQWMLLGGVTGDFSAQTWVGMAVLIVASGAGMWLVARAKRSEPQLPGM